MGTNCYFGRIGSKRLNEVVSELGSLNFGGTEVNIGIDGA